MLASTAAVSLRLAENGPPGATRMMKNVMTISANSVGIAPRMRLMAKANMRPERGCGPAGSSAGPLSDRYFSTLINFVGWTSRMLSSHPFTDGFTRWRDVVMSSGVTR